MKTEISRFCEASLLSLGALPEALENAAEHVEKGSDPGLLQKPLAALNELRARLRSLVEKLASQQAYLLIFGPLKSGKSTLMNAISGTYVSEVTSLPGYPCLVYVQNCLEPRFSVTRYNGRESLFADGIVLKDVVADSHLALAQQIRATELRGESFDPRTHFTEAIRRIDIKVPVRSLAESSTVLVDTPGLYSRMNFGYDVLTKEFRNSAACAVFVVKADNLFLEQVFLEFNQLLGLFSRIFLIINVDASKRDLQADGTLAPSQESLNPEKIIEAFKTLSMARPLREAYEAQRVRIHAVDLLNAASVILMRSNGRGAESNGEGGAQEAAFQGFLRDLTEYLNSSDYTREFIGDTLRQGNALCLEAGEIVNGPEISQLRRMQADLGSQMSALDEKIAVVDRLLRVDWEAAFDKAQAQNAAGLGSGVEKKALELTNAMRREVDQWFGTAESLQALAAGRWTPLLVNAGRALALESRQRLEALLGGALGGAEPAALVMTDLHAVGFGLGGVAQEARPALGGSEDFAPYEALLEAEELPVRKLLVDWLLFRKIATVRRRLFGDLGALAILPEVKRKRLPEASRAALFLRIDRSVAEKLPALPAAFSDGLLAVYVEKFRGGMLQGLKQLRRDLVQQRCERQAPFDLNKSALDSLEALSERATAVFGELHLMARTGNA